MPFQVSAPLATISSERTAAGFWSLPDLTSKRRRVPSREHPTSTHTQTSRPTLLSYHLQLDSGYRGPYGGPFSAPEQRSALPHRRLQLSLPRLPCPTAALDQNGRLVGRRVWLHQHADQVGKRLSP